MAIQKRLTDRFELVYLYDPSLLVFSFKEMAEYAKRRDIKQLDLTRCKTPPSVFVCDPLKPKFQFLLNDLPAIGEVLPIDKAWAVFCTHVKAARDCNDDHGKPLLKWKDGGEEVIDDECEGNIPTDIIQDIGTTIARKAGDTNINFTIQRGIFWERLVRLRAHHAGDATTETANETNT